jgi:chromatin structure-remodeling complex subunit RSC1/2
MASVPVGPGSIPLQPYEDEDGKSRLRPRLWNTRSSEEKIYYDSINFKGEELSAGDFVHLYNPSNPKLPIIAQIFSCYKKAAGYDRYLTVNWYYRPSQTSHDAERTFYEQEAFKTNLFVDHKLEDFIERVSVMHISDYTKGRWDTWHEDMPVYVVEHRWNIETNDFTKIRKWYVISIDGRARGAVAHYGVQASMRT